MTNCEKSEQLVCISCVEEVRYSFVSHLSEALRRKGIDDEVVEIDCYDPLSKESQATVEKAKVSVVVLPGNYEPTRECLDNFLTVLDCQRNKDQAVVPVSYGEGPLHIEWLTALDLRGLSPIHKSRKECSDSTLVKEIVRDVYEKLFSMGRIGIYSKLLEIENMVCKQPMGIRRVGIWGMPGIGKTTLAKAVFDQMSLDFDACCFIEHYDTASHENRVYRSLVEQLMKDEPGNGGTILKPSLLRERLNSMRVLVVLDDVRNALVAESFLDGFDWFGPESLIIVTSRDKQVFCLCQINQVYEVQGLNEKEALQLFFTCASIEDRGEQSLHELSMEVVKHANGNPLALSIYGRELKGQKKPLNMATAFLKLKQCPPFEIVDAIKSTYDTLSNSEKNIFLDIACFFPGENVAYVMQFLEGCGFFPHVGIDVLVDKCLVTISENRVRMHNLIQEFGRETINDETTQIERRSRLWEPQSIKYILEDKGKQTNGEHKPTLEHAQGTEEIEGIFLDTANLSFDVKPAAFENMLNLRLLKIYCSNPEIHPVISFPKGSLHFLPNELRLLHWENYPLQFLPPNFDPMHLVEINMPYSQLQKLWCGTKNLEMLRTIRLCHSQELVDIHDLLKAQNLEVIDLQGCTRLQSFPPSGQLLHLRVVNLSGCTEIKSFPEIPPNIETLHLQGTGIIDLPLSIIKPNGGELVSLSEFQGLSDALILERFASLVKSSSSIQDLGKLICLELKDCSRLRSLPNMVNLEFLKVLDLSGCSELETIQGFPRNLKELYLVGTAVRQLPQLPQSLELFDAHGCVSLHLSPQVVSDFLVEALAKAEQQPRELQQDLNVAPAFSFCGPSHANQNSTIDLKPGSSVMTRLNPSWRNTLVGFAMLVEVAFSDDYCDATGFGISCVCTWKNKEGRSHRIERYMHCWAPRKAVPNVQKDHLFVFVDVNMRPSTDEGNDPDIWADLLVFEFFPFNEQTMTVDDSCTVTRCGVRVITSATGDTSLENISPVLSLDPMEIQDDSNEKDRKSTRTENKSMAFEALTGMNGDLITRSWNASKIAYQTEHYIKEEAGEIVFFAFRPSFSANDLFTPGNKSPFGEIKMKRVHFPCMRSIGNDVAATVNEAFLKHLELIIGPRTSFYASVKSAVERKQQIVFTGHSSGGAIAILASVWYLETYFIRTLYGRLPEPRCVTFGAPLVGDYILSHAIGRENWSHFFLNFVTRFDIVPRIMLAPKASIEQALPFFLGQLDPTKALIQESDQRITDFYRTVMRDTSTVAGQAVCRLIGNGESFLETLTSFLESSPYRPVGTFVFSTEKRLVAVTNSDAILQMLFYTSQSSNEQEWSLIPYRSIRDHNSYEELVQSMEMKSFNHLDLPHLLLDGENSIGSVLKDLGVRTRARKSVHAALEAEKQRVENEKKIQTKRNKIEEKLRWIMDEYKAKCQAHKNGYYDSFKVSNEEKDFQANVKRAELAGFFDEVLGLVKKGQLPDGFESRREWIELATQYRRLTEPLDIANYYRHLKNEDTGPYMVKGRRNRYIHAQRGYEHEMLKPTGMIAEDAFWNKVNALKLGSQQEMQEILKISGSKSGSCFWAEVEELKGKRYEEVEARIRTLEGLLEGWITEKEVDDKQIFLEGSTFRKWWNTLPDNHKFHSPLRERMMG